MSLLGDPRDRRSSPLACVHIIGDGNRNDDVYILAMAVDSRYRLTILTDSAEVELATKKLKKEVHKAYHKSVKTNTSTQIASDPKLNQPQVSGCQQSMITECIETTSVCQSSSNSVWDAVRERCTIYNLRCDFMDMQEILDIEVDNFLHTKNIDVFNDPTKWWRENISTFKHVGIVARHYLGLAATEVSSERLFSHAGAIVTNRRKNLTTEHVEQLVFLHDNL